MPACISNLAVGLASFAQYEFTCGRGYAFSESYLAKPAAEILAACYPGKVVFTEVRHPVLKRIGRGGRPRVDLGVLDDPAPGRHRVEGAPLAFLEIKWCGDALLGPAPVLWDLYRLASIQFHHPDIDTYFALVGLRTRVDRFLEDISETRIVRGRPGPFLRPHGQGAFRDLRFPQLTPALRGSIAVSLGQYQAGAFDLSVGIRQVETVRHDAAPHEWRPGMRPRMGFTAIVNRIQAAQHPD